MPLDTVSASILTGSRALQALGIAFALCCVAVGRARGGIAFSSHEQGMPTSRRKRRANDMKRKRSRGSLRAEVCEGLVDLIRDQEASPEEKLAAAGLSILTRDELTQGRVVVVVIGPASTKVYQDYVANKLIRYLRWSNIVRKHFPIADQDSMLGKDRSATNSTNAKTSTGPEDESSPNGGSAENGNGHVSGSDGLSGQSLCANGNNGSTIDNARIVGNGGGEGGGGALGTSSYAKQSSKTDRYTFSDRGKAAALATIAVQESAKKVATWLNGLKAGGVAVVEAGSGWASTRRGRGALPGFLRQTTGPNLGILWVEVLPSGLSHRREGPSLMPTNGLADPTGGSQGLRTPTREHRANRTTSTKHSSSVSAAWGSANQRRESWTSTNDEQAAPWKSANGLPRLPRAPGEHVVDTFLHSGNLLGAGGNVLYESVRGSPREMEGGRRARGREPRKGDKGGGGGVGKSCFVSLADQGADVRTHLRDESCPLVRRIGMFAAALKMKKSWHGCTVYLTRHGESLMNQTRSMGGDTRLSETGDRYAGVLADFVAAQADAGQSGRLSVWCSPMKRAVQTARAIKCHRYAQWQALRELDTGVFNGYSYSQVETENPAEFTARENDKLSYRYPEGESYLDVVNRLDAVVVALEREDGPVMIVSHQAVLRCLYAYFMDIPLRFMPRLPINLHTVVKLTPTDDHQGGTSRWSEVRFTLIRPTRLEQLAEVATIAGAKSRRSSQLGETLS